MAHVNLLKQFKTGTGWVMKSIPKKSNGQRDWGALPDGSYFIEWREEGKRMRLPAGRTVSQALEAQHIKLAELAATEVGILQRYKPPSHTPEPEPMRLSASIRRYLDQIDTLKKPNSWDLMRDTLIEKLMPMQPSPMAETSRLVFPSSRFCISSISFTLVL